MHVYAACSSYHHSHNNVDDSTMNKRDASIGVPPGDLTSDFPLAQSVAPLRKRSCFRKFVAFMSRHRRRTTASPVNVETNYGTLGEFITVITYLPYELVLTSVLSSEHAF